MPNHTKNLVYAEGSPSALSKLRVLLTGAEDGTKISFEHAVPMPAILKTTVSGARTFDGQTYRAWYRNPETDEERPFTDEERAALKALGSNSGSLAGAADRDADVPTWYSWSLGNWGTKWDAYDQDFEAGEEGYLEARFTTAWDYPSAWWASIVKAMREETGSLQLEMSLRYRLEDDPEFPHEA